MTDEERLIEQVAGNIKRLRAKLGMSQAILAAKCKVNVRYVQRLERQPQNLTLAAVARFAKALGVVPNELLKGGKEKPVKVVSPNTMKPAEALRFAADVLKNYERFLD